MGVKMRGLPYRATDEEVVDFFNEYKIKEDSLQWGLGSDGRKNGWGAILLESEDEASRAAENLNKQTIGSRWIGTSVMTYADWKKFNAAQQGGGGNRGSSGERTFEKKTLKLASVVNDDNISKALIMRGLPFRVKNDEIKEFFAEICEIADDNIHIEEEEGRRSGAGLCVFESEDQAQEVKEALNRKEIGGRFIQLFDRNDNMWNKLVSAE